MNVDIATNRITLSQEQAIQKIVRSQALSAEDITVTSMAADLRLVRLVFAPVVSMDSVRTVLSLAAANPDYDVHQGDISAAFIHPKLKEDIWIVPPPRHHRIGQDGKPQVLKLLRTLYGLKSSPLAWFECFTETILGFAEEYQEVKVNQLISDSCIFIVQKGGHKIYTTIYVDDVLTVPSAIVTREWFFEALYKHFDLQASETGECT